MFLEPKKKIKKKELFIIKKIKERCSMMKFESLVRSNNVSKSIAEDQACTLHE
jgi:hypothetical protein